MNNSEYTSVISNNETTTTIKVRRHVFTGNEKHDISLEDAARLTKRFRDAKPEQTIKGGFFARTAFERTLVQEACVGIRCYFAAFDDGTPTIVIVGATREGNDIWDGALSEEWIPCPPRCPAKNALNSDVTPEAATFESTSVMFTGKENHRVTLAEASRYTRNFRAASELGSVKGGFVGRAAIEKILGQEHCVGIRMYFALHEDGSPTVVFVGVKPNGDDIINGALSQEWIPCPPKCSTQNPLNM